MACGQATQKAVPTRVRPTPLPTSTPLPPLPTLPPVGSSDNPIVYLLVNPDGDKLTSKADALAKSIASELNLVVQVKITASYAEARQAMCTGQASVISADAFAYLSAVGQTCGDGLYTAEIDGSTSTQGEMLAGLGRDIFTVKGFAGYRFCRPGAMSVNGWFVPTLSLKANQVDPLGDLDSVIDSGSDTGVIKDIIALKCDVGAARLGAEENIPGAKSVLVIDKLPPVPNDTIMLSSRLEGRAHGQVADNIRDHLDEFAALIGANGLVTANDKEFDALRQLFTSANVDVLSMGN